MSLPEVLALMAFFYWAGWGIDFFLNEPPSRLSYSLGFCFYTVIFIFSFLAIYFLSLGKLLSYLSFIDLFVLLISLFVQAVYDLVEFSIPTFCSWHLIGYWVIRNLNLFLTLYFWVKLFLAFFFPVALLILAFGVARRRGSSASESVLGMGDIGLVAACGFFLSFFDVSRLLVLGSLIGILMSLLLGKGRVPFGFALALAFFFLFFFRIASSCTIISTFF